jgi:hypothetical protein
VVRGTRVPSVQFYMCTNHGLTVVYLRVPESRTTYLIKVERHRTFVYTLRM